MGIELGIDAVVWARQVKGLKIVPKLVLLILCSHANVFKGRENCCWCTLETLATEAGSDRRSIQNGVKRLVELKLVVVHKTPHKGKQHNLYEVRVGVGDVVPVNDVPPSDIPLWGCDSTDSGDVVPPKGVDSGNDVPTERLLKAKVQKKEPYMKKQKFIELPIELTPEQDDIVNRFNSDLCSVAHRTIITTTEADRKAMFRIMTDKRDDGERYTIHDIEQIGIWLENDYSTTTEINKTRTGKPLFIWLKDAMWSFKDLLKTTKGGDLYYRYFHRKVTSNAA